MTSPSVPYRLPVGLIVALVALRLAVGWHFYTEGTKKLVVDKTTGQTSISPGTLRATEMLLNAAVGPWADLYHAQAPGFHDWQTLLVVPREVGPLSDDERKRLADWEKRVAEAREKAVQTNQPASVEFPPVGPYSAWAERIVADWQSTIVAPFEGLRLDKVSEQQVRERVAFRRQQLADYLAGQADAIAEWQHELWRLRTWKDQPEAADVPYQQARIAEKEAETTAKARSWVEQVRGIERGLRQDLHDLAAAGQASPAVVARVDAALADAGQARLLRNARIATVVVTGVGVSLLLGLFVPLACVVGGAFLLSVIASQPPWVPGAITTVFGYQLAELAAFVVLLFARAGRYAGLDALLMRKR